MTMSGRAAAVVISSLCRIVSGARAQWIGCRPLTAQRIYYANHSSHLDFILLWSALPQEIRCVTRPVAARDYWEATAWRRRLAVNVFNAVLIDRKFVRTTSVGSNRRKGIMKSIDDMGDAMADSHSLILFPEGTRGDGSRIGSFKGGLYELARRRGDVDLIPVFLENLNRILPKGEFLLLPLICSVNFGTPIRLQNGEKKAAFLERARKAIVVMGAN